MTGSHVHRVLEQLPEQQRTQIELAYWSGLSQAEIAALLNVPMSTVKARTHAALMQLADLLDSAARVDVPDRDHGGVRRDPECIGHLVSREAG